MEKTSLTPMKDETTALWTDETWQEAGMSDDGSFTFDIDRVEMAWVKLQTEDTDILDEGYKLATIYYITDDWAKMFDSVYSEENALKNGSEQTLSGWCGMYVVEVATETTDVATGETTTTYSYYLFGYAYNDGMADGVLYLYYLNMDD